MEAPKLAVIAERPHERPWVVGPFDTEERAREAAAVLGTEDTDTYVVELVEPDAELKYLWP